MKQERSNRQRGAIKIRIPENNIKVFSKEEFLKLINSVKNDLFKDIFLFSVLTGMRMNEVINCKPSDIDIDRKLIKVYGRKTDKTRFIEAHKSLIPIFEKYKLNEYLFMMNEKQLTVDYLSKITKKLIKRAGINPSLNFKTFRATFGKFLLDEGVNLKYISQMLGHSGIQVTERAYAKYITTELTGWIDRINV